MCNSSWNQMAAHGIGITIAIILDVVIYVGYKYNTTRGKAAAPDMEDVFGCYNRENTNHSTKYLSQKQPNLDYTEIIIPKNSLESDGETTAYLDSKIL